MREGRRQSQKAAEVLAVGGDHTAVCSSTLGDSVDVQPPAQSLVELYALARQALAEEVGGGRARCVRVACARARSLTYMQGVQTLLIALL